MANKQNKKQLSFLDIVPGRYVYLAAGLVIVALILVTVLQRGSLYNDTTDYEALRRQNQAEAAQYAAELAAIQPDYQASQQFLKKVASEDLVRQQIYNDLKVNQKIVIPQIPDNQITVSTRTGKAEVVSYLTSVGSQLNTYNRGTAVINSSLFTEGQNPAEVKQAQALTAGLVQALKATPVPKEAVDFHKAQIAAYQQYGQFLSTSYNYQTGADAQPWSKIYGYYLTIDNRIAAANTSFNKLDSTYKLSELPDQPVAVAQDNSLRLIPVAQAQIGVGSVVVIKDLPRLLSEAVRTGLARALAKFMITSLDKMVAHIEKNFAIASQLYYSQALGQFYSVEYMKKFVQDPLDQKIIQYFLPQYFCTASLANAKGIQDIFVTKAKQYVNDIGVFDPNNPDYTKIARYGDFMASAKGWELYYEGLAAQTGSSASDAASKEVVSPGVKTGRSLIDTQINKTVSSIFNVQQAAISGTIQLGTNNTENVVGQLVAGVVESLVNKFVFTPLAGGQSGGGIGVLQENNVCIKTPQFKPLAPVPETTYQVPPMDNPNESPPPR